ncbi:MAG: type II toxin-antitoxin system VapC family toxin [Deltaproteobacteria bacterium]|nr:type II toxin-antitoxin system VapC family toxin [Deltaproteobacteria bacterium]MBI3076014.1 type II toxin-antitoxin system VapC family toxin [Deltaproteobacteria bacterium]
MAFFVDSSAAVKYYVTEAGSTWVRQLVDGTALVFLAEITLAEVAAALSILQRLQRLGLRHRREIWERFDRDCTERYHLIPVPYNVVYSAALLCARHPLKAYDAVQLAAGLALRRGLDEQGALMTFVSSDDTLLTAAQAEGLTVENPLRHTALDS